MLMNWYRSFNPPTCKGKLRNYVLQFCENRVEYVTHTDVQIGEIRVTMYFTWFINNHFNLDLIQSSFNSPINVIYKTIVR